MWTELVKIKFLADPNTAKQMEKNLSARFAKTAKMFGNGLQRAVKGSILGISLGLLNKLLNPLEALDEKIKSLLGEGNDIRDLADRFNTSPGQIKRLQDVANSLGVQPDQLKDMMLKYAQAVEQARNELNDPTAEISQSTRAVKNFVDEKDMAVGFEKFISSLRVEGQGPGRDVFFSDKEQQAAAQRERNGETLGQDERQRLIEQRLLRHQSGTESRQSIEQAVFGEAQFGGSRRLIEADLNKQFEKLKEPDVQTLNAAVTKVAGLADQQKLLETQRQTADFVKASANVNDGMIKQMEQAAAIEEDRVTRQLQSYDDLKQASIAIGQVKGQFENVLILVNQGIGKLAQLATFAGKLGESRLFRSFLGGRGE